MSDYLDYVGVFSLSILAVSGSYFVDFNSLATMAVLSLVPASMGYTAYISRDGFTSASLSSVMCLFLVGFNPFVSFVAAVVAVSNPLVSVFAGGNSFKDYFNAVALPMLLTGLIVGGGVYGLSQYDDSVEKKVENAAVETVTAQADVMLDSTSLFSGTQDRQVKAMQNVSKTSILLAEQSVVKNMSEGLDREQFNSLRNSFDYAEASVPAKFNASNEKSSSAKEMVSDQISSSLRNLIDSRTMIALVPMLGLAFYSLSPFIGLFAAVFGVIFREVMEQLES